MFAPASPIPRLPTTAWWLFALIVAAVLLAATSFTTRDADSRVYITIASKLASEPLNRWIAPQWWGAWGMQGLFREHPIGTFVLPALLARSGYPSVQSSFVITLGAQIVSLMIFVAMAERAAPVPTARSLAWTLQLLPIAFVFRIRANQEYLLLAGLLLALVGVDRARRHSAWLVVAITGYVYAVLVKGVFALLAPICGAIWIVTSPRREGERHSVAWLGVAMMLVLTPILASEYERLYVATTGQSFLDYYLGPRIALEGSATTGAMPFPFDKMWNAGWYLGRVAWYAAPWSLLLPTAWSIRGEWVSDERRRWILYCVAATLATVLLVALRDTKADRYVFPAYFFAAAGGTVVATARWPRVEQWALALDRSWPWGPVALWFGLFLSRLLLG